MLARHAVPLTAPTADPHFARFTQFWCNLSPLDATLLSPLLSVANKELAQYLSPLNATLTKNMGGGAPRFMPFPYLLTSLHLCFISSFSPVQSLRFHPGEK